MGGANSGQDSSVSESRLGQGRVAGLGMGLGRSLHVEQELDEESDVEDVFEDLHAVHAPCVRHVCAMRAPCACA